MRHKFEYQGKLIYEWEQTLADVNIYIEIPEGVAVKLLYIDLESRSIRVGIKPNPPYLQVRKVSVGGCQLLVPFWPG